MNPEAACPVCDRSAWTLLGVRSWRRSEVPRAEDYVRRRLEVLFDVWQPGCDVFVLRWAGCRGCGFVGYLPRPTPEELDAKYEALAGEPLGDGGEGGRDATRTRARSLYRFLRPFLEARHRTVLDFGGGDGALMRPFADRGLECFVLDYTRASQPFVRRLGSTLRDLAQDRRFDVIVAGHVVEHLADPRAALSRLREHVAPRGLLYVEVPLEVWRAVPPISEPVTHVNFFTPGSLRRLLERAGFDPRRVAVGGTRHPTAGRSRVIRALARVDRDGVTVGSSNGWNETRRLLSPRGGDYLKMAAWDPRGALRSALLRIRRAGRALRRTK